jgi:hypothetical protein
MAGCAGVELAEALQLPRGPGAGAEATVDGVCGLADGVIDLPPVVMAQLGEVAPLRAEGLGERADVELAGVGAG